MIKSLGSLYASKTGKISARIILIIAILVAGFLLLKSAGQLKDILEVLQRSDPWWIVLGVVTSILSYTVASVSQFAAGNWQGSFQRVHTIQWAGNLINRFLPFNVGSIAMTTRHYQKHGRKPAEALTVATLPSLIGYIQNILLMLILAPFTIVRIVERYRPDLSFVWLFVILVIVLVAAGLIGLKFKSQLSKFWKDARSGLTSIKEPYQLAVLIFGSIVFTSLLVTSLYAAMQAVSVELSFVDILTLYLLSILASSLIPTPGGLGGTEATLVAGLASLGVGMSAAISITLIFRFMTFWVPLAPGAVALYFFRRRNAHPDSEQ